VSAIHDRTLRILANSDDIQVFATSDSAQGREPATTVRRRDSQSDVMNAASRAVATLTKSSPRPDSVGGVVSESIPGSESTRAPTSSEALRSRDVQPIGWTMATGIGAGLLLREGGTDPRLEGALPAIRSNLGARLEGDFISSRSPEGSGANASSGVLEILEANDQCVTGRVSGLRSSQIEPPVEYNGVFYAVRCESL
jgi:hypothetical protein